MNRIDARFQELARRRQAAFIPYITAGDPTLEKTGDIVLALERAGADIIEFGIPFSDPIADGPVNQEAAQRALRHNVSLRGIVRFVKQLREKTQVPIVLFTYFNPVFAYGIEEFARDAGAAGVDGVLCVDLPPEESDDYKRLLDANGVATVYLLAPTSTPERVDLIARQSTGFIYYVSRTGVTGVRDQVERSARDAVEAIKARTDKPVVMGFGIATPAHAQEVAGYADGVVVGSAIVRLIGELGESPDLISKVEMFARSLADAVKGHAQEGAHAAHR